MSTGRVQLVLLMFLLIKIPTQFKPNQLILLPSKIKLRPKLGELLELVGLLKYPRIFQIPILRTV